MIVLSANARGKTVQLVALRPQDVFATSIYTGNDGARAIVNGLDLAGKGGLVWLKARSTPGNNLLFDTVRGAGKLLCSNLTAAEQDTTDALTAFNSNGFSLGSDASGNGSNQGGTTEVAWAAVRAAKFFDIVTWAGNDVAGRQIPHGLGIKPGLIIVKRRDTTSAWSVYHCSLGAQKQLSLNYTFAASDNSVTWNGAEPDASTFTVGNNTPVNASGSNYVAYLFAHDPDTTNGIIQCGSYPTAGNGAPTSVSLGWKPQFILIKDTVYANNWVIFDAARGLTSSSSAFLRPNKPDTEQSSSGWVSATNTGFNVPPAYADFNDPNYVSTYVYLAIRAPV